MGDSAFVFDTSRCTAAASVITAAGERPSFPLPPADGHPWRKATSWYIPVGTQWLWLITWCRVAFKPAGMP